MFVSKSDCCPEYGDLNRNVFEAFSDPESNGVAGPVLRHVHASGEFDDMDTASCT